MPRRGDHGATVGFARQRRVPGLIAHTRALPPAALDGSLAEAGLEKDPSFRLMIPRAVPGAPASVLDPRGTWADKADYDRTARDLTARFEADAEGAAEATRSGDAMQAFTAVRAA